MGDNFARQGDCGDADGRIAARFPSSSRPNSHISGPGVPGFIRPAARGVALPGGASSVRVVR